MTKEETIQGLQELYDRMEDSFSLDECSAVSDAIKKLQNATIWTPCTERMPTVEDADKIDNEFVNVLLDDGYTRIQPWQDVDLPDIIAWSRIEPKGGGNG